MGRKAILATCTLNQWALDFDGNFQRILESIRIAKEMGASFRSGPELEISGYGCEDHFFEGDTLLHSWEVLHDLLASPICHGILIDVGMPIMHNNLIYNCRVVFFNKEILLIRPKLLMCDSGNYRETRWFSPWRKIGCTETYYLPRIIQEFNGQRTVTFGDAVIATLDTVIGFEICEELWSPQSTHIPLSIDGVEIIVNSSGSYTELRKAYILVDLIRSATLKCGGCYMYSNLRGCDGQRLYFNGSSCVALNGQILNYDCQFSLKEVEVICATIDLEDIRSFRNSVRTRSVLADLNIHYQRIIVPHNFSLSSSATSSIPTTLPRSWRGVSPEEEIALGPACWLWDYLRRSGQGGFFLPLSGGVDSASSACIVYSMCRLVVNACKEEENGQILEIVRKIVEESDYVPKDAKDLCGKLFVTAYMGTENSSSETRNRSQNLATQIGSYHMGMCIDIAVKAVVSIFDAVTGRTPRFIEHGGSQRESLALQNIQARLRMVLSYLFAQLTLWVTGRSRSLLVLASGNVDEALRGYLTKYDCSSADLNPIGSISKTDLKRFLVYAKNEFELTALEDILTAVPTAELTPLKNGVLVQTDEEEMGMTYDELSIFGNLRKNSCCGPYSMYCKLLDRWGSKFTSEEIAEKVKHFFRTYAINRHKMTVITPSYHAEQYSPDDNRFDHRQFLYNIAWTWQFKAIDQKSQARSFS